MRSLAVMLIRWRECGYTRGLEIIQMSSGVMCKGQPYYMNAKGVQQLRAHVTKEKRSEPPYADQEVVEQLARAVQRRD